MPNRPYIQTLSTSTAISDHVSVDFEFEAAQSIDCKLLEVIQSLLRGQRPGLPATASASIANDRVWCAWPLPNERPASGPMTQSGCGAICPSFDRGCYGCFGPAGQPNCEASRIICYRVEVHPRCWCPLLRNFNATAPAFREEGNRIDPGTIKDTCCEKLGNTTNRSGWR